MPHTIMTRRLRTSGSAMRRYGTRSSVSGGEVVRVRVNSLPLVSSRVFPSISLEERYRRPPLCKTRPPRTIALEQRTRRVGQACDFSFDSRGARDATSVMVMGRGGRRRCALALLAAISAMQPELSSAPAKLETRARAAAAGWQAGNQNAGVSCRVRTGPGSSWAQTALSGQGSKFCGRGAPQRSVEPTGAVAGEGRVQPGPSHCPCAFGSRKFSPRSSATSHAVKTEICEWSGVFARSLRGGGSDFSGGESREGFNEAEGRDGGREERSALASQEHDYSRIPQQNADADAARTAPAHIRKRRVYADGARVVLSVYKGAVDLHVLVYLRARVCDHSVWPDLPNVVQYASDRYITDLQIYTSLIYQCKSSWCVCSSALFSLLCACTCDHFVWQIKPVRAWKCNTMCVLQLS